MKEHLNGSDRTFLILLIVTLLVCIPSFVLYGAARLTSSIPSEAVWSSRGGNHGPWWDKPQGILLTLACLAMPVMPFVTFLLGLTHSVCAKKRKLFTFIKGMSLAAFQVALSYELITSIVWVID
ncbi:MAG: hypothetical protein EOP04_05970 [Proteobacteria bacterium]|nr:MAG: hypothetical protein EOP04_05970 [Pseudomonadota bacterium]